MTFETADTLLRQIAFKNSHCDVITMTKIWVFEVGVLDEHLLNVSFKEVVPFSLLSNIEMTFRELGDLPIYACV